MLVLSRFTNQKIFIGDDISVIVVDIRGDRVRLGIDAPPNLPVHREEIHAAIQREKAGLKPPPLPSVPANSAAAYSQPAGLPSKHDIAGSVERLRDRIGHRFELSALPPAVIADMWRLAQAYIRENGS